MKTKTPIRTCIACGKQGGKRELLRVVRTPEGQVCLDESGKAAGRGAYVCRSAKCFELACKKKMFAAKLKTSVSNEDLSKLQEDFLALITSSNASEA